MKVYQKPKTANSENGKGEWNANMAVKFVKNRKRKASRTSRILHTYKKEKATHHVIKQKPIIVWEVQTAENQKSIEEKLLVYMRERKRFILTELLGECRHHCPQNLVGVGLQTFYFWVQIQKLPHSLGG